MAGQVALARAGSPASEGRCTAPPGGPRVRRRKIAVVAALAAVLALAPGCGYQLGYRPVDGIREVAVPIFDNRTLRRGYEYQLTAEVRRLVLETTPLHLAREGSTRAVLEGAVVAVTENVLITGTQDAVVESSITITALVALLDRRSGRMLVGRDEDGDGRPDRPITLTETQTFAPGLGTTRDDAAARAIRDLAERIVQLLEAEWGGAQGR